MTIIMFVKKWKEFDIELTSVDGQGIIKEYLNNYRLQHVGKHFNNRLKLSKLPLLCYVR